MSTQAEQTAVETPAVSSDALTIPPIPYDDDGRCSAQGHGGTCVDHGPVLCLCGHGPHDGPLGDCTGFVPTYNAPQACHLTGATYRQWDYWTTTGRVVPVIRAQGSGTVRRYLAAELDAARLALALMKVGFTLDPAWHIARYLIANNGLSLVLADVFELTIRVRDTTPTSTEENSA